MAEMTRDEQRRACFKAMAEGLYAFYGDQEDKFYLDEWLDEVTAAFDSLHDIVRIVPIGATEEMLVAARNYFSEGLTAYYAIAAAGDLTNKPDPFGTSAEAPK